MSKLLLCAGVGAFGLAQVWGAQAQVRGAPGPHASSLQEHYDAAEALQGKGDLAQAAFQYELFLAEGLRQIASGYVRAGEYLQAVPIFDEALKLHQNDAALRLEYAQAALAAHDLPKAQTLAQQLVDAIPKGSRDVATAKLYRLLGEILLGMDDNTGAKRQFEAAVAINPTFENGYALAQADLALLDKARAAKLFAEMLKGFGDTAGIHMEFGLAYGDADFPEEAIPEFRRALEENPKMPGAHYSLGASYLRRSGDTAFPQAEAEFRRELELHPDDALSYAELGYIAMSEHKLADAEHDLTRAAELDPKSADTFLMLGDLYGQMDKSAEQETALRKAIAVTTDPSRNHYQIRGAHYQLGLLLIRRGDSADGRKEMQIAQDLLLENRKLDVANLEGKPILRYPVLTDAGAAADPGAAAELAQMEKQLGPALADSFNNLGVIAAEGQDYKSAAGYFEQAARWNPAMDGLDYNWGRAAFAAGAYAEAVGPLSRYLLAHPGEEGARGVLGLSQFMAENYAGARATLEPLDGKSGEALQMGYAYAKSLIETGDTTGGVERLVALEKTNPNVADIHRTLGEAYAAEKVPGAAEELEAAIRLKPADVEAHLALGRLQLAQGDAKSAIVNLEAAAKLQPGNAALQQELAEASRQAQK